MATQEPGDIAEAFARAGLLHRQGRLTDAASLYREVLLADPAHSDAHHMLGLFSRPAGRVP